MMTWHSVTVSVVGQASEEVVGADRGPVSERAGLPQSDGREQRRPGDPDPGQ